MRKFFLLNRFFTKSNSTLAMEKSGLIFSEKPCTTCPDPCTSHAQVPASTGNKIDKETALINTFKPYNTHILIRQDGFTVAKQWPSHLEEKNATFINTLAKCLESRPDKEKFKLTGYQQIVQQKSLARDESEQAILFPSGKFVTGLNHDNIGSLARMAGVSPDGDALLDNGLVSYPLDPQMSFVLICAHTNRDKRCGYAGAIIVQEFERLMEQDRALEDRITVLSVSHFGGHRFAGNCIVYHQDERRVWVADWYGRVKSCHVQSIINEAILGNKIIKQLWRGRSNGVIEMDAIEW